MTADSYMLVQVLMVGDDVSIIADEVARMSAACELVITCGGVGPTLDDVTMEGVARALDTSLARFYGYPA